MIKWEKIDFWVVPMISIGMCLLSEVIDKIILAILFCIFASIKVQQNQFGNQVPFFSVKVNLETTWKHYFYLETLLLLENIGINLET